MAPGRGYSAGSFNNRTTNGGIGKWGGGSGARVTTHRIKY
jgi:hypothetical protein